MDGDLIGDLIVCRDLAAQYVLDQFFDWLPKEVAFVEWVWKYDARRDRPMYVGCRVLDFDDIPLALDLSPWRDAAFELMRGIDPAAVCHGTLLKYLRSAMLDKDCEVVRFGWATPDYEEPCYEEPCMGGKSEDENDVDE